MTLNLGFFKHQLLDLTKIVFVGCSSAHKLLKDALDFESRHLIAVENVDNATSHFTSGKYIVVFRDKAIWHDPRLQNAELKFSSGVIEKLLQTSDSKIKWNMKSLLNSTLGGTRGFVIGPESIKRKITANNGVCAVKLRFAQYIVVYDFANDSTALKTIIEAKVNGYPCKGNQWLNALESESIFDPITDFNALLLEGLSFYVPKTVPNLSTVKETIEQLGGRCSSETGPESFIVFNDDQDYTLEERKQMKSKNCVLLNWNWLKLVLETKEWQPMHNAFQPTLPSFLKIRPNDLRGYTVYLDACTENVKSILSTLIKEHGGIVMGDDAVADIVLCEILSKLKPDLRYGTIECFRDWIHGKHSTLCPVEHQVLFVPANLCNQFANVRVEILGEDTDPVVRQLAAVTAKMGAKESASARIFICNPNTDKTHLKKTFLAFGVSSADAIYSRDYIYDILKSNGSRVDKERYALSFTDLIGSNVAKEKAANQDALHANIVPDVESVPTSSQLEDGTDHCVIDRSKRKSSSQETTKLNTKLAKPCDNETSNEPHTSVSVTVSSLIQPESSTKKTSPNNLQNVESVQYMTAPNNCKDNHSKKQLPAAMIYSKNESHVHFELCKMLRLLGDNMTLIPATQSEYLQKTKLYGSEIPEGTGIAMYPETGNGSLMVARYNCKELSETKQRLKICINKIASLFSVCGFASTILMRSDMEFKIALPKGDVENTIVACGAVCDQTYVNFYVFTELLECVLKLKQPLSRFCKPKAVLVCNETDNAKCNCQKQPYHRNLLKLNRAQLEAVKGVAIAYVCMGDHYSKKIIISKDNVIESKLTDLSDLDFEKELTERDKVIPLNGCHEFFSCENCFATYSDKFKGALLDIGSVVSSPPKVCRVKGCVLSTGNIYLLRK